MRGGGRQSFSVRRDASSERRGGPWTCSVMCLTGAIVAPFRLDSAIEPRLDGGDTSRRVNCTSGMKRGQGTDSDRPPVAARKSREPPTLGWLGVPRRDDATEA